MLLSNACNYWMACNIKTRDIVGIFITPTLPLQEAGDINGSPAVSKDGSVNVLVNTISKYPKNRCVYNSVKGGDTA